MSVHVLSWVLKHSEETLGRRLVLIVLADHAKEDGTCAWPSVETIANESRLSERQVQYALRGLEASSCISCTGHTKKGTRVYSVNMGGADIAPVNGRGGAIYDSEGVQSIAPEPSLEPSYTKEPNGSFAQALVAEYVDQVQALGAKPAARAKGQVARLVGELLAEGQPVETISGAISLLVERRLHPSTLPTLLLEATAGPARKQNAKGVSAQEIFSMTGRQLKAGT